ncbi:MAG: hypothetical protein SH856_06425 [Flavobacteriales bacterium]|nr:hypothetical protein [Flavobacteriales bacterium]
MKLINTIKYLSGKRALKKEREPVRNRKGCNFNSADRVAILYRDQDESFFKKVKAYAKYLKEQFGIKSVHALAFVDQTIKKLPVYQSRKLEFDFFSREDLNWQMRPIHNVKNFLDQEFDILLDLSGGDIVPLNFVLKESKAGMKVGLKHSRSEKFCDLTIDMGAQTGLDKFIDQINRYLSNPNLQ